MPESLQPYSLIWIAAILLVVVAAILFRNRPRPVEILAFAGVIFGLVAVYFFVRPVQTVLMEDAAEVQAMIGAGQPVLLEFQSPY